MSGAEKEVQKMFDSLSRDQLIELLLESGFDVNKEGSGNVIYSETMSVRVRATFKTRNPENNSEARMSFSPIAC